MDSKTLMEKQIELLELEKHNLIIKTKQLVRKIDHTERAFRQEEIPLWKMDYEKQKELDHTNHAALMQKRSEDALLAHAEGLKNKKRLSRMTENYNVYSKKAREAVLADHAAKKAKSEKLIAEAKAARLAEIQRLRVVKVERMKREEKERLLREEEERIAEEGVFV